MANPPFGPPTPGQIRSAVAQQRLALREYKEVTTGTEADRSRKVEWWGFLSGESWFHFWNQLEYIICWNCMYIYIYISIYWYIYIYVYTCTYTYIYNQNSLWWNLGKKHGTSPALNLGSYAIVTYPDSSMQMELFLVACPDELMECLHCSPQLWSDRVVLHRSWVQWIFKLNHDT